MNAIKDDDDRGNNKNDSLVCDFDVMMQKKKEENRILHNKRKKAKDIDMINDNDDAIAKVSNRCLMVSTNQADPSCFYFIIS